VDQGSARAVSAPYEAALALSSRVWAIIGAMDATFVRLLGWRLGLGLGVLGLWELAAGRWIDPFWFSSPLRIAWHLADWTREGSLFGHLFVTLRETFLGFLLGSMAGIAVGVVLARLDFLARVLDPFIVAANGIPRVALAPLFIIWFGIGELSKVVLASTLTFFLTFYGTFSGLRAVEPAYRDVARVMGASERQIFVKVALPAASPWIVSALKVGVPFSLIGAIIGEFMAASRGLGYMIQLNTNQFDTTGAASGILVLMVCVMLFNGVLNRLERYVLRWRPRERAAAARELL
jgi:NitT/TauT family transport system permease protein